MKQCDVPQELIDAAIILRDIAKAHGYKIIACAFHPAQEGVLGGSVSIYNASIPDLRIMVEEIVAAMNMHLDTPIKLQDDWLPWEYLADETEIDAMCGLDDKGGH